MRRLSDLPEAEARAALAACWAHEGWVGRMLSQRPFKDRDEVFQAAERYWREEAAGAPGGELADIFIRLDRLLTL